MSTSIHPLVFILPLISAMIYAVASLFLQRATRDGIGPWRTSFYCNLALAVLFAPSLVAGFDLLPWEQWYQPFICGALYFIGQIFAICAIHKGNISVSAPVMGSKVVIMALFSSLILQQMPSVPIWIACVLTTLGIILLRGKDEDAKDDHRMLPSFIYGFLTAAFFGFSDMFFQKWGTGLPFNAFIPKMFLVNFLCALVLPPFFSKGKTITRLAWKSLAFAAFLLCIQSIFIAYPIATFGEAILVNIFFASRGIWTVLAVFFIGKYFLVFENQHNPRIFICRLVGSVLLLAAMIIAMMHS